MTRTMTTQAGALVSLVALALLVACSSDGSAAEDPKGSCATLASACHAFTKGGGLPEECHDLGHAGDDGACFAKKSACLAACPAGQAPPSGTDGGGDAGDSGEGGAMVDAGGADPACAAYCACVAGACAAIAGYPFAAAGSCASACASQSADERACFPKWCAKAESSRSKHDCEHAWGGLGLDECSSL